MYVGNKEISATLGGRCAGQRQPLRRGITFNEVFGRGELEAKVLTEPLWPVRPAGTGLIERAGGASRDWASGQRPSRSSIYVIPGIEREVTSHWSRSFAFHSLEMTGKVGLEAADEAEA